MTRLTPEGLTAALASGLLAFPLADFDAIDTLDTRASAARLEWLGTYRPAAFFMAGGAGEFFSPGAGGRPWPAGPGAACTSRSGGAAYQFISVHKRGVRIV
jgi:hypothetical protein